MWRTFILVLTNILLTISAPFAANATQAEQRSLRAFNLLPYPQKVTILHGFTTITSSPKIMLLPTAGPKIKLGQKQLNTFFEGLESPHFRENPAVIVLASLDETRDLSRWLSSSDIEAVRALNSQGYLLRIGSKQIVIAGRTSQGTLYGVQTLLQMLNQSVPEMRLPRMKVEDYPEVSNRYVDVTFAWYAHYYSNTFGYGTQLWGEKQWHWFVDWALRYKINGIDLCIYGYWPFRFPAYPKTILADIPVRTYDPETKKVVTLRMTHTNIEHEFLTSLIRYAQERGIRVNAYIGLNTFNGGYVHEHPEALPFSQEQWKKLSEAGYSFPAMDYMVDLSDIAARQYLRDSVLTIMHMGFDGITFEMIELPSSVCTKPACISMYWAGYESFLPQNAAPKLTPLPVRIKADTDILNDLYKVITQVRPHADVGLIYHRIVEMYGWGPETLQAFQQFRELIPREIYFLQGPRAPRDAPIEGSDFARWVKIANSETYRHSDNIGGDAAAHQRLLYINNDPDTRGDIPVPSLEWEMSQHRAAAKLHLQGATGYAFEWYGNEIYPLILAQYSWRSSGPDGVPDRGFLEYAMQSMYGQATGKVVGNALALVPPPMDHYPSAWVARANQAADLANKALHTYSGVEQEYRRSLEQIRTATLRKAWLYEVERLQKTAESTTGDERKRLLEQALAKAEQVGSLLLDGEPRVNYRKGFFGRFEIFEIIKKIADELGVEIEDKFKETSQTSEDFWFAFGPRQG